MIGILGEIPFSVTFDGNNIKALNFTNLKRSGGANYEQHKRRGLKPVLELIDLSLESLKLDISLRSDLGQKPKVLLGILIAYSEAGKVLDFVLGQELLGKFVIDSYDAGYEYITNNGKIRKIDVGLSLKEYIDEVESTIEVVSTPKKKTEKKIVHEDYNQGAIIP
ncbi:hypothetical protein PM10SUCC1_02730 [Propionigenium maris DSM 9537]|uniref:Uncharacterized protein n=1 Tax=Propionigenium maris DSM 9537 TaxID=1123000 RepID=A0A9W6GGD1_9FUSO|nr:phage tail protein [Propionigenium maris]GLI54758.1 hypothetical protein PM10SUCC1_02730 [Propionigenium maris DSM 9537]